MANYFSVLLIGMSFMGAAAFADGDTQQQPTVDRAEVDKSLSDLNDTLTKARAVPSFENGKPAGYKVVQPTAGGNYQKLGLKNDDIITGVNGQQVNDPQKAFEMMGQMKKTNQLQIVRDGTEQTVNYDQSAPAKEEFQNKGNESPNE